MALRLSPGGEAYAVQRYEGEPDDEGLAWRVTVPHLVQPRLAVDPESSSFRVVGKDPRSRGFVRVRGRVGDAEVKEDRWTAPADLPLTFYEWYATEGARALALGMSVPQSSTLFQPWILALIGGEETVRGVALAGGRLAVTTEGDSAGASVVPFEVPR